MQNSEKLCLKWNDFQENLNLAFGGLRNDRDLVDVTLVCEDGTQIETHKVILASSSPFFMEILKKNKHPHPMIYMRELKSDALVAIVDFLYFGEAKVNQESLDAFLGLAEELKLKGLSGGRDTHEREETKPLPAEMKFEQRRLQEDLTSKSQRPPNGYNANSKSVSATTALVSVEADQIDEEIKSMMTYKGAAGGHTLSTWVCNVCGKEDKHKSNMKTHIEANHITSNISYSCDICGKVSRSKTGLRFHKARQHFTQDQRWLEKTHI